MKMYRGYRPNHYQSIVMVDTTILSMDKALKLRSSLWDISPEWGYAGSGPTMLALAILLDCLEDDASALKYYEAFRDDFLVPADYTGFIILEVQIRNWLEQRLKQEGE
jgi:hypothetical protein